MEYENILNYDRDWEEIKQEIMPPEMSEAEKESLMDTLIVKAIITNT